MKQYTFLAALLSLSLSVVSQADTRPAAAPQVDDQGRELITFEAGTTVEKRMVCVVCGTNPERLCCELPN